MDHYFISRMTAPQQLSSEPLRTLQGAMLWMDDQDATDGEILYYEHTSLPPRRVVSYVAGNASEVA